MIANAAEYLAELGVRGWSDRARPAGYRVSACNDAPKLFTVPCAEIVGQLRSSLASPHLQVENETAPVSVSLAPSVQQPMQFRLVAWTTDSVVVVADISTQISIDVQSRFVRDLVRAIVPNELIAQEVEFVWPPFAALKIEQDAALILDELHFMVSCVDRFHIRIGHQAVELSARHEGSAPAISWRDSIVEMLSDSRRKADFWLKVCSFSGLPRH